MASFGATIALAVSGALERVFDLGGLPALPLLSVAFLLVNANLLWRHLRPRAEPTSANGGGGDAAFTGPPSPEQRDPEWGEAEWTAADLRRRTKE